MLLISLGIAAITFVIGVLVREAFHICDKIYILHKGKILEAGPPEKIAASKIVRSLYLGENFTFKMKADRIPLVNQA